MTTGLLQSLERHPLAVEQCMLHRNDYWQGLSASHWAQTRLKDKGRLQFPQNLAEERFIYSHQGHAIPTKISDSMLKILVSESYNS